MGCVAFLSNHQCFLWLEARFGSGAPAHFGKRVQPLRLWLLVKHLMVMCGTGVLTVLLLLRQALLSDLDVSLPGLESLDPALSVID